MPPPITMGAFSAAQAKPIFANPARRFANRVGSLPGIALYPAVAAAAVLLATIAGAFGTGSMPIAQRLSFWTLLIGFHTALWVCWFAWRIRKPSDWWMAVLLGVVVVNLALPLEIAASLRIVGIVSAVDWRYGWFHSAAISAAILFVVVTAIAVFRRMPAPTAVTPKGRLWRAGFHDPGDVAEIVAEDHYCRIWHVGGSSRLVHGRFSDLVAEVGAVDGLVVRRGHWVAASAVRSIGRSGRSWTLDTGGDRTIRVAPSSVAALRERGWLASGGVSPSKS